MEVVFKRCVKANRQRPRSQNVWLHKILDMPIIPQPGMEVVDGDWSCVVEKLCFADGRLYAFAPDDNELSQRIHEPHRSIEEVAAEHVSNGWQISSRILGT